MITITPKDRQAIEALAEAARVAWSQSRLMRMHGVDLTRSDMAMQRLNTALAAVDKIVYVRVTDPSKPSTKAKTKTRAKS